MRSYTTLLTNFILSENKPIFFIPCTSTYGSYVSADGAVLLSVTLNSDYQYLIKTYYRLNLLHKWNYIGGDILIPTTAYENEMNISLNHNGLSMVVSAPKYHINDGVLFTFYRTSKYDKWNDPIYISNDKTNTRLGSSVYLSKHGLTLIAGASDYNCNSGIIYTYNRTSLAAKWMQIISPLTNTMPFTLMGSKVLVSDKEDILLAVNYNYNEAVGQILTYTRTSNKQNWGLSDILDPPNDQYKLFGYVSDMNSTGTSLVTGVTVIRTEVFVPNTDTPASIMPLANIYTYYRNNNKWILIPDSFALPVGGVFHNKFILSRNGMYLFILLSCNGNKGWYLYSRTNNTSKWAICNDTTCIDELDDTNLLGNKYVII